MTYRLCDHTTADDARRYAPTDAVKSAWDVEPIARLGYYLESQGLWSREKESELQKTLAEEVETIINEYLETPAPKPTDMFDYLYAELPESLKAQRDTLETYS